MRAKNQVVSGTLWTAVASATQAIVQILRLSILTRFLEKSDFGLIAIVVLILGFTQIFADLGISVSLFSRQNISKNEYSSLYWISLLLGGILYGILCLCTPALANFYNQPELAALIPVMGLDLFFVTAGRQFRIFQQKAMQFRAIALIDMLSTILSLTIAVALRHEGVWSLVYSTLFASFISSFLLIASGIRTHPLRFYINVREGRSFYRTGIFQTGSQILDYTASQLDILIIGKLMGPAELGVYNLIKQLVLRIYGLLNPIITRVSIPLLAALNDNLPLMKEKFLQMLRLTSFINFAIYGLLALLGRELLIIIYGSSYQDSAPILQIFCIWGGITSVTNAASSLIIATGRTELGFRWTIVRVIANPILIVTGYQFGFLGIVIAQATYALLFYNLYWKLVIHKIANTILYSEYLHAVSGFLLKAVGIAMLLFILKGYIGADLVINVAAFGLLFTAAYLSLNRNFIQVFTSSLLPHRFNLSSNPWKWGRGKKLP